jgi:hypothetical protein
MRKGPKIGNFPCTGIHTYKLNALVKVNTIIQGSVTTVTKKKELQHP